MDQLTAAIAYYFFEYPIYGLGNFILSALMWTMLGRFVLSFLVAPDSSNYIWRFFRRLTDPVLDLVRKVTPEFMVDTLMPLVGVWWLIAARIAWWISCVWLGLVPRV